MAKIKVNAMEISNATSHINTAKTTLGNVEDGIWALQRNMDTQIQARNGISANLTNIKTTLTNIEKDIMAISQTVTNAVSKYAETEVKVVRLGQEIGAVVEKQVKNSSRSSYESLFKICQDVKIKTKSVGVGTSTGSTFQGSYQKHNYDKKFQEILDGFSYMAQEERTLAEQMWNGLKFEYSDNIWENFFQELGTNALESSGSFTQKLAGLINVHTAVAHGPNVTNSFVIVNPNVAPTTAGMVGFGGKLSSIMSSTGAKVGIPIVGGVIDYFGMVGDGEEEVDAAIKATVHVGIGLVGGLAGGKAGAALGGAIGSVIPGAGTVVGAAVGFVAGVAITTAGNAVFDTIYDNREAIADTAKEIWNTTKEMASDAVDTVKMFAEDAKEEISKGVEKLNDVADDAKEKVSGFFSDIGDACVGGWILLKTAWA